MRIIRFFRTHNISIRLDEYQVLFNQSNLFTISTSIYIDTPPLYRTNNDKTITTDGAQTIDNTNARNTLSSI